MPHISASKRAEVRALHFYASMPLRAISRLPNMPSIGSIHRILRAPEASLTEAEDCPDPFPKELSDDIYAFVTANAANRRKTYAEIAVEYASIDGMSTYQIRRWAKSRGMRRCKAVKKPFINDAAKCKRWQWASEVQGVDWSKTMFSDEAAMQNGSLTNLFVTRDKDEEFHHDCLRPKFRKLTGCMIWGAIGVGYKSQLVFWDHSLGNMKSGGYRDHVLPVVQQDYYRLQFADWTLDGQWRFMQDNAPIHKAKIIKDWFVEHQIPLIYWPSCSPDMNPIENLWSILKTRLQRRRTELTGLEQWKVMIQEEWDLITQDEIDKLILNMPARTAALLRARGGHTRF